MTYQTADKILLDLISFTYKEQTPENIETMKEYRNAIMVGRSAIQEVQDKQGSRYYK